MGWTLVYTTHGNKETLRRLPHGCEHVVMVPVPVPTSWLSPCLTRNKHNTKSKILYCYLPSVSPDSRCLCYLSQVSAVGTPVPIAMSTKCSRCKKSWRTFFDLEMLIKSGSEFADYHFKFVCCKMPKYRTFIAEYGRDAFEITDFIQHSVNTHPKCNNCHFIEF